METALSEKLAANPVYQKALAEEMAQPPPTEADVVDIDELFAKLRPDLAVSVRPRHRRPVKRNWWSLRKDR